MPLTPGWPDIALRLLLTLVAGALVGFNRGEHGHPAGLRTTLLVCLAASLSMIAANLLLDTRGKPDDSFVVLDLMRLPLGILSGMGFIGAGAIIRRGDMVEGITTAATLWFVTVVGLCFGAGLLAVGAVATALGFVILTGLKAIENRLPSEHRATVEVTVDVDADIRAMFFAEMTHRGYRLIEHGAAWRQPGQTREFRYEIQWRGLAGDPGPAEFLGRLATTRGIVALAWRIGAP